MDAQLLTYLFVFLSFSLYIGIAIWSRAGSTDEFYVAGGGVHPIANGMAPLLTDECRVVYLYGRDHRLQGLRRRCVPGGSTAAM